MFFFLKRKFSVVKQLPISLWKSRYRTIRIDTCIPFVASSESTCLLLFPLFTGTHDRYYDKLISAFISFALYSTMSSFSRKRFIFLLFPNYVLHCERDPTNNFQMMNLIHILSLIQAMMVRLSLPLEPILAY